MELGEKLRLARMEAGLSQRQLCGDIITRNMLSQIEHGTARPSMDTLRQLASRLGKPVSFFLEEDAAVSYNQALMERVRVTEPAECWQMLKDFQNPDPMLEWEWTCRSFLAGLAVARQALDTGQPLYARQLLEETADFDHGIKELERQRLLLQGRIPGAELQELVKYLPSLDEELLLRAEAALVEKNPQRAVSLLGAVEDGRNPRKDLLLGQAEIQRMDYAAAAQALQKAEESYPKICMSLLEVCFRELGDFKRAYEYACKQR